MLKFISYTVRLLNSWPAQCFALNYDLNGLKY